MNKNEEEPNQESEEQPMTVMAIQEGVPTLSAEESLRLELLNVSKEILLGKAAMCWETHKRYEDVSVSDIITEAQNMFDFVRGNSDS